LPQKHAFRDETNPRLCGANAIQPNLISDFFPKSHAAFFRNSRREHPRGEPARLEHDDFSARGESMIEHDLRDLRGFSGTSRSLEDEPGMLSQ
jgi:hypothetical protein